MENISYLRQVRRMRRLAEQALAGYGFRDARLKLLAHRGNTVFRVDMPGARREDERRFVLRLYGGREPQPEIVISELLWLSAIREETGLVVPEPVPDLNGRLLSVVGSDGGEQRSCVLFKWVEGRFVDAGLTPGHLRKVGNFMAHLHRHAERFELPEGFSRPHWSWEGALALGALSRGLFSESEQATIQRAAQKVAEQVPELARDRNSYGLVHGDLQQTNYLFHRREARAIDFQDCYYGFYAHDMAITLFEVAERPRGEEMREAFFRGYEDVRPFPPDAGRWIKVFTATRLLKRVRYLAGVDNPRLRAQAPHWAEYAVRWLSTEC